MALTHHQHVALRDVRALCGGPEQTEQKIVSPPDTKRWQWLVREKGTEPWFIAFSSDALLDCLVLQDHYAVRPFTHPDHNPF